MNNFHTLFDSFSPDNHIRGGQFEVICKWFLENDPHYSLRLEKVWHWNDWPGRWGADCGIDLVAKDKDGKVWAIQAKCYDSTYSVTKHDVDKFLSESVNEKIDYRLLIATTDQIGENSRKVIHHQNEVIPVSMVLLADLEQAPLVWPSSVDQLNSGHTTRKATPRPHQTEAIEATASYLVDRGQMIMACGTGKTLTALWIAEKLKSKRTLVLLPSLLLLSKTLSEWVAHTNEPFAYLPVCSDETVTRGADTVMSSTSDLAFPSTTDKDDIARFLREPGNRVVFSTYQSSPKIAEAFKQGNVPGFDLVIADEAHRCAGKLASEYGTVLDEESIPAKKRLFMTATPRVYTPHLMKAAQDSGIDVASMDDEVVFGPVLHRLTFGQAIEKNLLSDYQVVVVGIDDPTYQQMVADRRLVETETGITSDARSLASHVGLAKAMDKYDLRRVITFHSRVNWASEFASELSEVIDWMPKQYRPSGEITCSYVSGNMSTSLRNQRLTSLADLEMGQRAVLSNAKCLSEGVDVPALDGVAFIDPKKSEIDIVQAVGRAIRLSPEKLKGTIIIPVFISDGDDPDAVLNSSEFDKVWKVVNALRSHDDALGEELDGLRTQLGRRGSSGRPSKIVFDIPTKVGQQFVTAFDTRLIEATTSSWNFWFGLLTSYVEREGHARPMRNVKTAEGFALGTWVSNKRHIKNTLSPERQAQLEGLPGWVWDVSAHQWEEGVAHLQAFVTREGHARPSAAFKTAQGYALGTWISNQRKSKRTLSSERKAQLEALPGWTWDAFGDKWQEGFAHLDAFVHRQGHASPASNFKTAQGYALGAWVATQRTSKSTLSPERQAQLEALPGWVWDVLDKKWEEGFAHLEAFIHREGHARPSQNFKTAEGFALGAWVATQRGNKSTLSPERQAKLEALPGWVWGILDKKWEEGFAHLTAFVQREGDARPSNGFKTADGFALGAWVATQRVNESILSPKRRAQLEALPGWVWEALEHRWEEGFAHLEAFVHREGHARPAADFKTEDGYPLGMWVARQRNTTRSPVSIDRRVRLEALPGWTWDVYGDKWEEGFAHLEAFVHREGHARPAALFKTKNGYTLGGWVSTRRKEKSTLSLERKAQLEALPGWTWDAFGDKWQEGFAHLDAFVHREGHARPTSGFKTADGYKLGTWVLTQRKNKSTLSLEQKVQLEALPGWVWEALEHRWEEGFAHLEAFVQREGHARPISGFKTADGYTLGTWVKTQRYNKSTISPERQAQLEALPGWVWDVLDKKWEEGFAHLEAFVHREGHARPAQGLKIADGFRLGMWVSHKRRNKSTLSLEQRAQLEALPGWVWNMFEHKWEEGFAHLEAFVHREGHARPSGKFKTAEGFTLGAWVGHQRRNKSALSLEQRAQLEALPGWVWKVR